MILVNFEILMDFGELLILMILMLLVNFAILGEFLWISIFTILVDFIDFFVFFISLILIDFNFGELSDFSEFLMNFVDKLKLKLIFIYRSCI